MTLARLAAATGANITHVPYRSGGKIVPDLLAGNITGAVTELSTVLPQIGGGKVRVLGVAANARSPQLPDVPTMIEQGVKDFTAASYVGVLVPAATPAEVVKALEAALKKALNEKDLQQKMLEQRRRAGAGCVDDLAGLRRLHQEGIRAGARGREARRADAELRENASGGTPRKLDRHTPQATKVAHLAIVANGGENGGVRTQLTLRNQLSRGDETMIRTLVIATMLVAAGPALAKDKTIRGCTGAGYAGCGTMQVGKETVLLMAMPAR